MSAGVRFEWVGKNVVIRSLSGNYLYTVQNARDVYHDGGDIVVVSSTMSNIRFTKEGFRKFE